MRKNKAYKKVDSFYLLGDDTYATLCKYLLMGNNILRFVNTLCPNFSFTNYTVIDSVWILEGYSFSRDSAGRYVMIIDEYDRYMIKLCTDWISCLSKTSVSGAVLINVVKNKYVYMYELMKDLGSR